MKVACKSCWILRMDEKSHQLIVLYKGVPISNVTFVMILRNEIEIETPIVEFPYYFRLMEFHMTRFVLVITNSFGNT